MSEYSTAYAAAATATRKKRQEELTAQMQGYELDEETNRYIPNKNTRLTTDLKTQQLEATIQQLQSNQNARQSSDNATAITNITSSWMGGSYGDAMQAWNNTPGLKESLGNTKLDVANIEPINFGDPTDTDQLKQMGVTAEVLDNKEYKDAISRSLMKITGQDGKKRLVSTSAVIAQTNTYNMMNQKQKARHDETARFINNILTGLSPEAGRAKQAMESTQEMGAYITRDALATKDVNKVMEALQLTKPELYMKATGDGGKRRDSLKQYTTAFMRAYPNASMDQFQGAMGDFVQKYVEGGGAVKERKDVKKVVSSVTEEKPTVFEPKQAMAKEQQTMTALKSSNKAEYDRLQKDITTMKDNHVLATNIDKILQGSGKKVDTDMIASIKDTITKWFGIEDTQTLDNVLFQTESGMLVADYILSRSGTAASDTERDFLSNLMRSGKMDDETYVRQALEGFASSLRSKNKTTGTSIEAFAPFSTKKYITTALSPEQRARMISELKARQGR